MKKFKKSSHLFIKKYLNIFSIALKKIDKKKINLIAQYISEIQNNKKSRIFFLGVGGSAGNCSHAVNDFRKLLNIECYAATDNVSEVTARTNDEGWDTIFEKYLEINKINREDLIFIFSVGGGNVKKKVSLNIVKGIKYAKLKGAKIISILGKVDGYAAKNSTVALIIPSISKKLITPVSESFQSIIWHLLVSHPKLQKHKTKW